MSTTITPPPTPAEAATATVRNAIVSDAKSLPDLIAKAEQADPALAAQLTAKPLIASKSPPGVIISGAIGWAVAHYGLSCGAGADPTTCWSQDTVDLVSGVVTLLGAGIGAYIMRWITSGPIKGIFSKGATP